MNIKLCKTLRAVIGTPDDKKHAINYAGDKEVTDSWELVTLHKGGLRSAVSVRCYMGHSRTASTVYASVWIKCADGTWCSGRGSAGGYGYCKRSAAIREALRAAGVTMFGYPYGRNETDPIDMKKPFHMDGTGLSALDRILVSVARAAGYRGKMILV